MESLNKKKVSIIIPTYKRSEFLERAIESVLVQTYQDIEIIVIDDNKPESSYRHETNRRMLKFKDLQNVNYIQNDKNLGGALARNEGIKVATGEYIAFLDDDDVYLEDKIEVQLKFMLENNIDMSFCDVKFHNEKNRLVDYRKHPYALNVNDNKELLKFHLMYHLTPTSTYMIKRDKILEIGCFEDVEMGQEFMLMLKAINNNLKIKYLPVAKTIQYIHDGERISVGEVKINKEVDLYNFKKQYFKCLTVGQKLYIAFRHHMVLAVVNFREKNITKALGRLFIAFFIAPHYFIAEFIKHINKIRLNK